MKFKYMKSLISAVSTSIMLALSVFQANADKKMNVMIPDWTGGEITCEIAVLILEQELGYDVNQIEFQIKRCLGSGNSWRFRYDV